MTDTAGKMPVNGSSPRGRGKHGSAHPVREPQRLIPAGAGKTGARAPS